MPCSRASAQLHRGISAPQSQEPLDWSTSPTASPGLLPDSPAQLLCSSPSPGPSQLPLDAEEFVAAQLLLDGALQKEGPAVAGGISVVSEQDHQQEHHVDEEILASRE